MRRAVAETTKQLVLLEAGYMCANPRCRHILALDIHHIIWVREGGGNGPNNLLALCSYCHDLHTRGHIPVEAIRAWKGMLLSLNNTNRSNLDVLIHLYRMEQDDHSEYVRYSPDALIHLAGLINAGLVQAGFAGGGSVPYTAGVFAQFAVGLTEEGRMLVEAWMAGDEARVANLLRRDLPAPRDESA